MSRSSRDVYRILDANLNRLREGLRSVEEHTRFLEDRPAVTERAKEIRHHVRLVSEQYLDQEELIISRDAAMDVGASIDTESEIQRRDTGDVLRANLKRAQEASRVLEEFSKLVSGEAALGFKRVRFDLYGLEQQLVKERLDLGFILRSRDAPLIGREAGKGFGALLFRTGNGSDAEELDLLLDIMRICRKAGLPVIVEHRPHLCMAASTFGVQLDPGDLPVDVVRRILGPGRFIGSGAADAREARTAAERGADYIVSASPEAVVTEISLPVLAMLPGNADRKQWTDAGISRFIVPDDRLDEIHLS